MSVNTGLHITSNDCSAAWLCHKLTSDPLPLDSHMAWCTGDWQAEMGPELRLLSEGEHGQQHRGGVQETTNYSFTERLKQLSDCTIN